jgi:ketosteroid isomerase-like protein
VALAARGAERDTARAMSEENVEIVRRVFDAAARHDSETVLALYDPEIEFDTSRTGLGGLTQGAIYHGHEGMRSVYREWREGWDSYEEQVEELIDAGEHVISVVTVRARGRASGAEVELSHRGGVWTLRNGRVVKLVFYPTRQEALEAAGLSE